MSPFSVTDHVYMTQALRLAEQGLYTTQPNPRVGCVVVRDAVIVGIGAHHKAGEAHAEIIALQAAGQRARGASLYVNLEPCAHFGRTPPCVDAIIAAGVKRVVVAMQDANPLVAGAGIARLRAANIRVDMNLMRSQAQALNAGFTRRMTQQRPLVRSKIAASLDGRTALNNKTSQWITGEAARHDVQHWRARSCAVITGVETVLIDNPQLISRLPNLSRQPLRVVLDSNLRTPTHAHLLRPEICQQSPLFIAYAQAHPTRIKALAQAGAHLIALPNSDGRVDWVALMTYLATQQQVNEVWVEAGATLNGALLAANWVDEWLIYSAPVFLGQEACAMFNMPTLSDLQYAPKLQLQDMRSFGNDLRLIFTPDSLEICN